jgi:hypothetical protein
MWTRPVPDKQCAAVQRRPQLKVLDRLPATTQHDKAEHRTRHTYTTDNIT